MANGIIVDQDHSDQELMEDPSDWTSIAEQYGPFQDDLDIEVYNFVILRRIKHSHGHSLNWLQLSFFFILDLNLL